MRPHLLALLGVALVAGCAEPPPLNTRLDGTLGERSLSLLRAYHHTLLELDYGSHFEQSRPGQLNRVQRCKAQLKLVLTSTGDACGTSLPLDGSLTAAHTLTVTLDLTRPDPAGADVTDVVLSSGGRTFWGEGTMLLSKRARARVPREVRCNSAPGFLVPGTLSGHLILAFYADRRREGDRLGWLEGDFISHGCSQKSEIVASIE